MLLPGHLAIRGLTSQQCLASCRSLNLRRVAILSSLSTSIARQYATSEQRTAQRPVSRPKAHTGRTTATRKPRAAPRATGAGSSAGVGTSSKTRNTKLSKAKPKAKSKAKPKAKKKAQPKKRRPRPLTDKQKAAAADKKKREELKTLKEKALLKPPTKLPATAFGVILYESAQGLKGSGIGVISRTASAEYKALSTERREVSIAFRRLLAGFGLNFGKHFNHIANENRAKNNRQYRQWIESYPPAVIREANRARASLSRQGTPRRQVPKLQDDRDVKGCVKPYNYFYAERLRSGDFSGIRIVDAAKRLGAEWKALSTNEKKVQWHFYFLYSQCHLLTLGAQPYVDLSNNDMARYEQEIKTVYNRDVKHYKPSVG